MTDTTPETDSRRQERLTRERLATRQAATAAKARQLRAERDHLGPLVRTSGDRSREAEAAFAAALVTTQDLDVICALAQRAMVARYVFGTIKARHSALVADPHLRGSRPTETVV